MVVKNNSLYFFITSFLLGLIISAINPHDYFTWFLEVLPGVIAFIIILLTHKRFPLSQLSIILITIHSYILFIGGHYTYAEVPLFNTLKKLLHHERNNFDKIGHFMQGFVPAIIVRELLIRHSVITKNGWLNFIIVSICLAISALYELFEAFVAIMTGEAADSFLGTQGYVWDTQSDMFLCMIGCVIAILCLSKTHDRFIIGISS